jgi:hypothetical protein
VTCPTCGGPLEARTYVTTRITYPIVRWRGDIPIVNADQPRHQRPRMLVRPWCPNCDQPVGPPRRRWETEPAPERLNLHLRREGRKP